MQILTYTHTCKQLQMTRTLNGVSPSRCALPNDQRRHLSSLPARVAEPMRPAEKVHSVQMKRACVARARALARARARSYRHALQLTAILPRGAVGPKNLVVEHPLEVLDREVDGRCNGVSCNGDKLGPVVNGNAAEQACGAYKSERAQRNGKE